MKFSLYTSYISPKHSYKHDKGNISQKKLIGSKAKFLLLKLGCFFGKSMVSLLSISMFCFIQPSTLNSSAYMLLGSISSSYGTSPHSLVSSSITYPTFYYYIKTYCKFSCGLIRAISLLAGLSFITLPATSCSSPF